MPHPHHSSRPPSPQDGASVPCARSGTHKLGLAKTRGYLSTMSKAQLEERSWSRFMAAYHEINMSYRELASYCDCTHQFLHDVINRRRGLPSWLHDRVLELAELSRELQSQTG